MKKEIHVYKKSKSLRRLGSFVLDLILTFIMTIFVISLVVQPIVVATTDYRETLISYNDDLVNTGLYYDDEVYGTILINDDYDNKLSAFYSRINELETYNDAKSESTLFTYDEALNVYVESGSEEELKNFYKQELNNAVQKMYQIDADLLAKATKLESYSQLITLSSLLVSVLLVFLLPSMIIKGGATIGMLLFHLKIVSKTNGLYANRLQLLFRFLVFFSFEFILMYYGIGFIILLISGLMVLLTKNKISIPDFICSTVVIDSFVMEKNILESEQIIIEIEKKDEENE